MAKGRAEHEARFAALNSWGKDLARRAKSKCELCEIAGEKLRIVELPPVPRDPDYDRCLLLCSRCSEAVSNPDSFQSGDHWRFLAKTVWSEVPVAQALALRLLRRQQPSQAWARDTLESVFVDDEVEDLASEEV